MFFSIEQTGIFHLHRQQTPIHINTAHKVRLPQLSMLLLSHNAELFKLIRIDTGSMWAGLSAKEMRAEGLWERFLPLLSDHNRKGDKVDPAAIEAVYKAKGFSFPPGRCRKGCELFNIEI